MNDVYTPTTGDVRAAYGAAQDSYADTPGPVADAEFDRWLAQERAKAWDAGCAVGARDEATPNPYRKDADL